MPFNSGSRMFVVLSAILDIVRRVSPTCDRPDFVNRAPTRLEKGTIQPDAIPLAHVHTFGRRDIGLDATSERRLLFFVEPLANKCGDGQDLRSRSRDRNHAAIGAAAPARHSVPVMTGRVNLPDRPVGELVDTSRQFDGAGSRRRPRQDLQRFFGRRNPSSNDGRPLGERLRLRGRPNTLRLSSGRSGASGLTWHMEGFSRW
jgi:hypothetical protein